MVNLEPAAISVANSLPLYDSHALFVVALPGIVKDLAHPRLQPPNIHCTAYHRILDLLAPAEFLRIACRLALRHPMIGVSKANGKNIERTSPAHFEPVGRMRASDWLGWKAER
jgi:hypothetical protein